MRTLAHAAAIPVAAALMFLGSALSAAEMDTDMPTQLRQLRQQNDQLQQQLTKQQSLIDELMRKVSALEPAPGQAKPSAEARSENGEEGSPRRSSLSSAFGKVHISGEGGVGLMASESKGQFPHNEFRVDEAKLFVEAPIWGEVYAFGELNFASREDSDLNLDLGELYLDVENLSRLWQQDHQLNLRAGRIDIPFGEEYLSRDAIDNPLISHSIMDFWGVDEGVELYGSVNKFQYVIAVQNGSSNGGRDFNGDKAITARLGVDPTSWLHLSVSAMRTGKLDVNRDMFSELWLGPGLVHSLGSTNTTEFEANVLQGDIQLKFARTTIKASGGVLQYDDNDPQGQQRREVYFYSVEATQKLIKGLYAAARWSQAFADKGFPLIGNGNSNEYFWGDLTRQLSLLSLGLGYRFSERLAVKGEYSFEWGRELDHSRRNHENLFALMGVFAF